MNSSLPRSRVLRIVTEVGEGESETHIVGVPRTLEISRGACVIPSPEQDPAQPVSMQALAPGSPWMWGSWAGLRTSWTGEKGNLVFSVVGYMLHIQGGPPRAAFSFSAELWDRGNGWRWAVTTDAGLWGQGTEARAHMARAHPKQ